MLTSITPKLPDYLLVDVLVGGLV